MTLLLNPRISVVLVPLVRYGRDESGHSLNQSICVDTNYVRQAGQ
jgi:hypothetical protein